MYERWNFGNTDFLAGISKMFSITINCKLNAENVRTIEIKMCQNFFTDYLRDKFNVISNNMAHKWEDELHLKDPKLYSHYCDLTHRNGTI